MDAELPVPGGRTGRASWGPTGPPGADPYKQEMASKSRSRVQQLSSRFLELFNTKQAFKRNRNSRRNSLFNGEAKSSIKTNRTSKSSTSSVCFLTSGASYKLATSSMTSNCTSSCFRDCSIIEEISCRIQEHKLAASDSTDTASKERMMQTSKQIARNNDLVTYPLMIPLKNS